MRVVCRIDVEWRGLEKIPPGGVLVAAKHQSTWETFALTTLFPDPTFVIKRELMWIPFFGWYTRRAGMIPVDRRAGKVALEGKSEVSLHGMFSIHGVQHEINLPLQVEAVGGKYTATGTFKVPYVKWGMKNPSTLILRVGKKVQIAIHANMALEPTLPYTHLTR